MNVHWIYPNQYVSNAVRLSCQVLFMMGPSIYDGIIILLLFHYRF